ncbi:GatB/YqeY domain-containing protein [Flavobacterium algicola]|uniref:GatB/YqeY domain-containing protein n=1 Tax=Flavobacterium algicola TaxID=556529 RepID=UPI001EFCF906|nr:GatB/YqeY domain-containing protein [Flavobacterium algicola]MCG9791380.1 GatB/YqeY domain-containing protein [Flavobacterium algicola]
MSLSVQIMDDIKTAMRAKDTVALEALRAIKSELLLAQTATGSKVEISEDEEVKLLQRLVKTRKESARIFTEQDRLDLAEPELAQIAVIEKFLPAQLSEEEVEAVIAKIIAETGASGIASMGKVMGIASAQLGGTAEGKTISSIVKKLLV